MVARPRGIGRVLLRDAVQRPLQAAGIVGVPGVLVLALSPGTKRFHEACGLREAPGNPSALLLTLGDARAAPDARRPPSAPAWSAPR